MLWYNKSGTVNPSIFLAIWVGCQHTLNCNSWLVSILFCWRIACIQNTRWQHQFLYKFTTLFSINFQCISANALASSHISWKCFDTSRVALWTWIFFLQHWWVFSTPFICNSWLLNILFWWRITCKQNVSWWHLFLYKFTTLFSIDIQCIGANAWASSHISWECCDTSRVALWTWLFSLQHWWVFNTPFICNSWLLNILFWWRITCKQNARWRHLFLYRFTTLFFNNIQYISANASASSHICWCCDTTYAEQGTWLVCLPHGWVVNAFWVCGRWF